MPPALLAASLALLMLPLVSRAQSITFPNQPLYLSTAAKPNIIMAIDNSGSTDFEVSVNSNGGELWWNNAGSSPCNSSNGYSAGFVGCGSTGTADVVSANTINVNTSSSTSSPWSSFTYLFPNGSSGDGSRLYNDGSIGGAYGVPPLPGYAWTRSSTYNRLYFNPSLSYSPWVSAGTGMFSDASITSASMWPTSSSPVTMDLTQDVAGAGQIATSTACGDISTSGATGGSSNWGFRVYSGMTIPTGTCALINTSQTVCTKYNRNGSCKTYSTQSVPTWVAFEQNVRVGTSDRAISSDSATTVSNSSTLYIRYFPATFYVPHGTVLSGYSSYSATVLSGTAPDGSAMDGYVIQPGNFSDSNEYDAAIQNFANWFSYYRKRVLAFRAGIGGAFSSLSGMRVAIFPIDNSSGSAWSTNVTMNDFDVTTGSPTPKQSFFDDVYGYVTGSFGTPNREAVKFIGSQYRRTDTSAPVQYACQENFGILVTDGYSNSSFPSNVGNVDTTYGSPYADSVSNTMADQTMYDYVTPLRTGTGFPTGKVPIPAACSAQNHDPALDCNANLHDVFYGMILNTKGFIYGVNTAASSDPYANPPTWPSLSQLQVSYSPAAVDDLWHAAINGRGLMFNATSPEEVAADLQSVLNDIVDRTSSAASVALNTGSLNTGSQVLQARFNSGDWSGDLLDFPVSTGTDGPCPSTDIGNLCNQQWNASTVLTAQDPNSRVILTYNQDTHGGVPFRWNTALGTTDQTLLNTDPVTGSTDNYGSQRLNYLRGVRTNETSGTPRFRTRSSVLGDIIDSDPYYVGIPPFNYGFNDYAAFRQTNYNRTPMVYVGANDGMLHGFRVSDGRELLAYVPGSVYGTITTSGGTTTVAPKLGKLTQTNYTHTYTVNGSPSVGDAYYNSAWHTVLADTLRSGGQGVFTLDVTDPTQFSEANASSLVRWEFTDADDADLGYSYSQPAIVKMHNGRWAVIVGNGYNNSTADDGHVSSTGHAALFILFLDHSGTTWTSGTDYIKLTVNDGATTSSPNGLATPAPIDIDGDGVIDRVYAGDLKGNLWRFDLTDASASNWSVGYHGSPLFVAKDSGGNRLPITERPEVGRNLLTNNYPNDTVVYFGTGRYLDSTDNSTANQNTQSFFGIYDEDYASLPTITRSNLQQQTITAEVDAGSDSYRTTSQNSVNTSTKYGWYIDLLSPTTQTNQGERSVANPILRNGRIIITTLIPPSGACSTDGDSWLMELDANSGARVTSPIFDVNQNGTFDNQDTVNVGTTATLPSGVKSTGGIMSRPTILAVDNVREVKMISEANGSIAQVRESAGGRLGRVTWREVTPN